MFKLKLKHLPLISFSLYFIKVTLLGPTWQDLGVCAILAALSYFYEFKSKDSEIEQLTNKINALEAKYEERLSDQDKKIEENRQFVASIKIGTAMKGGNGWGQNR